MNVIVVDDSQEQAKYLAKAISEANAYHLYPQGQEPRESSVKNPSDAWLDAIPDDKYAKCPCGCDKKFKFAMQENPEKHYEQFVNNIANIK